jgi:hypothetical protein
MDMKSFYFVIKMTMSASLVIYLSGQWDWKKSNSSNPNCFLAKTVPVFHSPRIFDPPTEAPQGHLKQDMFYPKSLCRWKNHLNSPLDPE